MSLKDNVDYVKKEISTEESFLESVFKLENFYKKYKTLILSFVALAIVGTIGFNVKSYMDEQNMIEANIAFNKVLNNPQDKEALAILKSKNEKLYALAVYQNDKTKTINLDFFKELQVYSNSIAAEDTKQISSVTQNQNFLLKDFGIFNKALIEAKNGEYKKAKESLKLISSNSQVSALSKMLEHYLSSK